MENNKQQTAVEWLSEKVLHREWELLTQEKKRKILEQAKEMENQRLIDLVQSLKDYTHESHAILGHDEREASEFVEIFKQQEQ
jgi:hypothetical protein